MREYMKDTNDLEQRFWNTFSWVDLEEGELIPCDAVQSHELFTNDEIQQLIDLGLVAQDSPLSADPTPE